MKKWAIHPVCCGACRDDPTIMAWSPVNEPHAKQDDSSGARSNALTVRI